MSNLPAISIKELMDAGVHFGHRTMRWNPKMSPFIFGSKNNIHIIDLQKTAPLLHKALGIARDVAARNGRILFVATKRQASSIIAEAAGKSGQYFVNHRWMGGTLTNWQTVSQSIKTLNTLEEKINDKELNISKKERLQMQREVNKLNLALGGIRKMGGTPDLVIVVDTNREKIAIQESKKLGVPVIAVVDTNCDPDSVDYIVPGNDDSIKSIRLFCNLFADAILSGLQKSISGGSGFSKKVANTNDDSDNEAPKDKKPSTAKKPFKADSRNDNKKPAGKKPASGKSKQGKSDAEASDKPE